MTSRGHYKDEILASLADRANIAQFVSFSPDLEIRFARFLGTFDGELASPRDYIARLFKSSPEQSVNVRSFHPLYSKSREFVYGVRNVDEALDHISRLAANGSFTIANETIDVNDGGVSGVALDQLIEFAPNDTPRCVEKPGITSVDRSLGLRLLETVYGFRPALSAVPSERVEFSLHPLVRGTRGEHTIIWEVEEVGVGPLAGAIDWPNRFSRFVGDKAFGLLIASTIGLPVPRSTVISRNLAPFSFGSRTGTNEPWLRTCPREQEPGFFTTTYGWTDPFALLKEEDPDGIRIASVLFQEGVRSGWSGALATDATDGLQIEGVAGSGLRFMSGREGPDRIPSKIQSDLRAIYTMAREVLGPVRMEWVHDGHQPWVVQLHRGSISSTARVIYPGTARNWHRMEVAAGLDALRELIERLEPGVDGIVLAGRVGLTSHFGDLIRQAAIPAKLESPSSPAASG